MAQRKLTSLLLDQNLLKRVDDFRFKHRFESKTDTIKWLLNWALDQKPVPKQT